MSVACRELFVVHRTPQGDAAALQGLSLEARRGELLAVLGPSGSGKSTLLRVVAGLQRPSAGTVLLAGEDLGRLSPGRIAAVRRAHVGLVGQHAGDALSPELGLADAVALPLMLRGAARAAARARAAELLERVGLSAFGGTRPHALSGGERQRAAVCVAIAHRPAVVLADEPTGELDAAGAREVLGLLVELAEQDGATVVLVTHDPAGAGVAHRVVRIRDGRVSQEGSGAARAVVVGRGGWLHVPEELLAQAGIADRARVRATESAVVLEPLATSGRSNSADAPISSPKAVRVPGVVAELKGIGKRFGSRTVFEDFGARFDHGTFTAVTGRSGSGKSTLLRILAGLERPDAGEVHVGGTALGGLGRDALAAVRARTVGVVGQEPQLAPFLTAAEQVELFAPPDAARTWLHAVGLDERADQRISRLSAGERQRVAIARALAGGRGLLLVDEPTSRLDEANAAAIAQLLARAAREHGATVVCATHDPVVIEAAGRTIPLDPASRG